MYTNKRIIKDKGIIIMSIVSVMAISGLVAGIMISDNNDSSGTKQIAELDETSSSEQKETEDKTEVPAENEQNAAANVKKETTDAAPSETTSENVDTASGGSTDETDVSPEASVPGDSEASVNAPASSLSFTNNSILVWPVETNDIIIDFSMDTTTYFATLDMYKTSDAVCIRSNINSPVYAAADGIVTANSYNEEIGHFLTMDLGNNYELTYGQLKDIQIDEGSVVTEGDLIGYISEPTKYYTVEGANLYLKMTCDGTPTDPLDYLNYEEP